MNKLFFLFYLWLTWTLRAGALKSFPSLALNPASPFPFISSLSSLHSLRVFLSLCLDKRRSLSFARSSQPQIETSFMPAESSMLVLRSVTLSGIWKVEVVLPLGRSRLQFQLLNLYKLKNLTLSPLSVAAIEIKCSRSDFTLDLLANLITTPTS